MPPSNPSPPQHPPEAQGITRQGKRARRLVPAPPPMQVVTKGWWVLRDEQASVDELEREDREQQPGTRSQ
jgi:hypothetical protein